MLDVDAGYFRHTIRIHKLIRDSLFFRLTISWTNTRLKHMISFNAPHRVTCFWAARWAVKLAFVRVPERFHQ